MKIDITNIIARDIRAGDIIYSIIGNIQYKIIEINYRFDNVILRFSGGTSYEDLAYNTLDEIEYKIFREITIE